MNKCKRCNQETNNNLFCSSRCSRDYYREQRTIKKQQKFTPCLVCGKLTYTKFCSRSCSVTNRNKNKQQITYYCKCNEVIGIGYKFKNKKFCKKCEPSPITNQTLEQLMSKYPQLSNYHSVLRQHSRKQVSRNKCLICGYDKHVEVCHRIPVSDFPMTTKISIVNNPSNLVTLCPNHHWEFDNGHITI